MSACVTTASIEQELTYSPIIALKAGGQTTLLLRRE
jgi:hypothetical protein